MEMLPFSKQPLTYDTRLFMNHKYAIDVSSVFVTEQHGFVVPQHAETINRLLHEWKECKQPETKLFAQTERSTLFLLKQT